MTPRWLSDVLLGARLGTAGGREGWLRTVLITIGAGLGVAVLLLAASVPNMVAGPEARRLARALPWQDPATPAAEDTLLVFPRSLTFRDEFITGYELRPEGAAPPLPPGVTALPGPGELVVSPALAELLASPDGALVAPRLNYPVVGVIGEAGLVGPDELYFYLGADHLDHETAMRIDHFGAGPEAGGRPSLFRSVLLVTALVVLLVPVATFVAVAARFGGEQRDRRLAAIRLVGADTAMVRRIAAGEALLGGLAGALVGWLLFLVGRRFVEHVDVWGVNVFTSDVRPTPWFAAATTVAAPALAVAVALLGQRRLTVDPLGLVRPATTGPRRLWWRLALLVLGAGLLASLLSGRFEDRQVERYQLGGGVLLVLLGVVALLPWLVEAVVRRLRGGPVAWSLATRRLQLTAGTNGRVVSGVAVAVTGMVAFQMLVAGAERLYVERTGADPERPRAAVGISADPRRGQDVPAADTVAARFAATTGVRAAHAISLSYVVPSDKGEGDLTEFLVGDCAALRELLAVGDCRDGDVFLVSDEYGSAPPAPGTSLVFDASGTGDTWTVPAGARPATPAHPLRVFHGAVAATPAAVAGVDLAPSSVDVLLELDPTVPDAAEHASNTAAAFNPYAVLSRENLAVIDEEYASLRRWLLAGATAILALIGLSLLVGTIEQLRERRRALVALAAFGTPRSTVGWSVLWQTAVPVALGLALATATGAGLGTLLLRIGGQPVSVDWGSVLGVAGAGAVVVLTMTALSLPILWRLMRPDGLRTE